MATPRDIGPLLQKMRAFLLGRQHINPLRFTDYIAARTQPQPQLPDGCAHKLSANYYYTRDARREVDPPKVLAQNGKIAIAASSDSTAPSEKKPVTPGNVWRWD